MMHPETIATLRERRPDLEDLPDEAVSKLSQAQLLSLRLYVRDLGRAYMVFLRRR